MQHLTERYLSKRYEMYVNQARNQTTQFIQQILEHI